MNESSGRSANFVHVVEGGSLTLPNSVSCVNSAFWLRAH